MGARPVLSRGFRFGDASKFNKGPRLLLVVSAPLARIYDRLFSIPFHAHLVPLIFGPVSLLRQLWGAAPKSIYEGDGAPHPAEW